MTQRAYRGCEFKFWDTAESTNNQVYGGVPILSKRVGDKIQDNRDVEVVLSFL